MKGNLEDRFVSPQMEHQCLIELGERVLGTQQMTEYTEILEWQT
jgi:hypothetical protein